MSSPRFIRPLIYGIATLITALLAATMLYNGWQLYQLNSKDGGDEITRLAEQDAWLIVERLSVYQAVLDHWAEQAVVHDLLRAAKIPSLQEWAHNAQSLLPGAVGLSLLNAQGEVLGDTGTHPLTAQCQADLKNLLKPSYLRLQPMPAWLHSLPNTEKQHIDFYAKVEDRQQVLLGFLVLSLSTDILDNLWNKLALTRQTAVYVRVLDGKDQPIHTLKGPLVSPKTLTPAQNQWTQTRKIRLYPTAWQLEIRQLPKEDYSLLIILFISLSAGGLLMIGVVIVTQRLLAKDYLSDIEAVKELLAHVAELRPVQDFSLAPRLQETAKVFAAIRPTAEKLQREHQKLQQLSRTDELTLLANRRPYREALLQAMQQANEGVSVCLVLLDLDGFKQLNDKAGHAMGDEILKLLAGKLREHNRSGDLCARLGGDEFAAIFFGVNTEFVSQWLERIRNRFMQAQQEQFSHCPQCTLSVGFTFIQGNNPEEDEERAFRRADHALYDAKKAGKNTFRQG